MAKQPSDRHGTRLSVRAATEPLPTPLPPPPRPSAAAIFVTAHISEPVPPPPHFDSNRSEPAPDVRTPIAETVPPRTLASPTVVLSLIATTALLVILAAWDSRLFQRLRTGSLHQSLDGWTNRFANSDEDLPYITAMPIGIRVAEPKLSDPDTEVSPAESRGFLLSELFGDEAPAESTSNRTRLR